MPPKKAAATPKAGLATAPELTANELKLLRTMATLMDAPPAIDYEDMKQMLNYNHAKNVKSALKNLIEKLKKQQNAATAATSDSAQNGNAATPEADDDNEESGESPKKKAPVQKVAGKKSKVSEEVVEEISEEEDKKVEVKKAPAAKKGGAAAKKGVGKATGPKKASAGGTKTAAKGKGKKGAKTNDVDNEAEEADTNVEGGEYDAAKGEDEVDVKMTEADGKLHESLPSAPTPSQEDPQEDRIVPAGPVMTGPPLYITIEGEVYTYTPYDVHVAESHEITLEHYLTWKKTNDYTFYIDPVPYSL